MSTRRGSAVDVAKSIPFDPSGSSLVSTNTEDAIKEVSNGIVASCYGVSSPWLLKSGYSDVVPMATTEFETVSTMHDPTISDNGTATGTQTTTTLKDTSKTWTVNGFTNYIVKITAGTGAGQFRKITSNTADTLTVGTWDTTPDATSTYDITELSSRLTVPSAGIYQAKVHASLANATAGTSHSVAILQNGSFKTVDFRHDNSGTEQGLHDTRLLNLAADDYIEMKIYNGNGSALGMNGGSLRLFMQIHRVGAI